MGSNKEQESPKSLTKPSWILGWGLTNGSSLFSAGSDG